jgi:hypothetical protein
LAKSDYVNFCSEYMEQEGTKAVIDELDSHYLKITQFIANKIKQYPILDRDTPG